MNPYADRIRDLSRAGGRRTLIRELGQGFVTPSRQGRVLNTPAAGSAPAPDFGAQLARVAHHSPPTGDAARPPGAINVRQHDQGAWRCGYSHLASIE